MMTPRLDFIDIVVILLTVIFIIWFVRDELRRMKPFVVISTRTNKAVNRFKTSLEAYQWVAERYLVEGPHGPIYEVRKQV